MRADSLDLSTTLLVSSCAAATGQPAGITRFHRDPQTGALTRLDSFAPELDIAFLARSPDGSRLYASNGGTRGCVTTFEYGSSLRPIDSQEVSGARPCHITISPDGRYVILSGYDRGLLSVHPIAESGVLERVSDLVYRSGCGPDWVRQELSHVHCTAVHPSGAFLFATDLGADEIAAYRLDDAGRLIPGPVTATAPGTGPRHLRFGGEGRLFVVHELSSTVSMYDVDSRTGSLDHRQTVWSTVEGPTLDRPGRDYPSELAFSDDHSRLYVANRGHDRITTFRVAADGLEAIADSPCGGRWPRHFAVVGGYLYVANQRSEAISTFRLGAEGIPEPIAEPISVPGPMFVLPC